MKPVYQTRFGKIGNCYAASVASILELPLDAVPDLSPGVLETRTQVDRKLNKWLAAWGFRIFWIVFEKDSDRWFLEHGMFHLIMLRSPDLGPAYGHCVVGKNTEIFFDPLAEPHETPEDDWVFGVFGVLNPALRKIKTEWN